MCNASCLAPTGLIHAEAKLLHLPHYGWSQWRLHAPSPVSIQKLRTLSSSVWLSRLKQLNVQASRQPSLASARQLSQPHCLRSLHPPDTDSLRFVTSHGSSEMPTSSVWTGLALSAIILRHKTRLFLKQGPFLCKCCLSFLPKNVHCLSFTLFLLIPLVRVNLT